MKDSLVAVDDRFSDRSWKFFGEGEEIYPVLQLLDSDHEEDSGIETE